MAIIAILAAILLPSLNKARERARATSCISNLKNIGTGSRMYSDEQKDWIVPNANGTKNWYNILSAGYTGDYDIESEDADKNVYTCPSADGPSFSTDSFTGSHYAINNWVTSGVAVGGGTLGVANYGSKYVMRKATGFKAPQSVKFVTDNHVYATSYFYIYCNISYRHGAGDPRVGHSAGEGPAAGTEMPAASLTNCLFLDGHAEGITYGDMVKTNAGEDNIGSFTNLRYVYGKNKATALYDIYNLAGVEVPYSTK